MNYRPIGGDRWDLARPKLLGGHKYYGAYPAGFLERARALMGVHITDAVLHVCGGKVKFYPYQRYAVGPNDKTLDMDPAMEPDFLQDARDPYPKGFRAIIADPPYSEADAQHYSPGAKNYPTPGIIVRRSIEALELGGRVGVLHYKSPRPPKNARLVAAQPVWLGYDMQIRVFTVYEKVPA